MTIRLLAFGIAKDVLGTGSTTISLKKESRLSDLKNYLNEKYEYLAKLKTYKIAVNQELIADDEDPLINEGDELAILPPVSGG